MLTNRKMVRNARLGVNEAHRIFHHVVGQKVNHRPGYYDGMAATFLARLEQIDDSIIALAAKIAILPKPRSPRKPTAWQLHVSKALKAGGTIQQAAESWSAAKAESPALKVHRS